MKNWKKKWFVLHFNALAYFEGPEVNAPPLSLSQDRSFLFPSLISIPEKKKSAELLGIIPLEDSIVEADADIATGYRFSFMVFSHDGTDYSLRASSEGLYCSADSTCEEEILIICLVGVGSTLFRRDPPVASRDQKITGEL